MVCHCTCGSLLVFQSINFPSLCHSINAKSRMHHFLLAHRTNHTPTFKSGVGANDSAVWVRGGSCPFAGCCLDRRVGIQGQWQVVNV